MTEKKKEPKTKAVAKTDNGSEKKRKAVWLGAQALLGKPIAGSKEEKERGIVLMASRALGVSPFGVNILGSLPYINKLGLSQKAEQYTKDVQFKYNWIKRAMDDNEKAICECKVVDAKGKELSDWITGECSPSSMKMGTLKGYQNHMAQTRAKNRAILETFGVRIHEDMIERIQMLSDAKVITPHQAALMGGAASSSTEEIQVDKAGERKEVTQSEEEYMALMQFANDQGALAGQEKQFIEKALGRTVDWKNLKSRDVAMLKTQLMAKLTK